MTTDTEGQIKRKLAAAGIPLEKFTAKQLREQLRIKEAEEGELRKAKAAEAEKKRLKRVKEHLSKIDHISRWALDTANVVVPPDKWEESLSAGAVTLVKELRLFVQHESLSVSYLEEIMRKVRRQMQTDLGRLVWDKLIQKSTTVIQNFVALLLLPPTKESITLLPTYKDSFKSLWEEKTNSTKNTIINKIGVNLENIVRSLPVYLNTVNTINKQLKDLNYSFMGCALKTSLFDGSILNVLVMNNNNNSWVTHLSRVVVTMDIPPQVITLKPPNSKDVKVLVGTKYRFKLPYNGDHGLELGAYSTPNNTDYNLINPHVNRGAGGSPCLGGFEVYLLTAAKEGRLKDFFVLLYQFNRTIDIHDEWGEEILKYPSLRKMGPNKPYGTFSLPLLRYCNTHLPELSVYDLGETHFKGYDTEEPLSRRTHIQCSLTGRVIKKKEVVYMKIPVAEGTLKNDVGCRIQDNTALCTVTTKEGEEMTYKRYASMEERRRKKAERERLKRLGRPVEMPLGYTVATDTFLGFATVPD